MSKDKHQKIKEEKTQPAKDKETITAMIGLILIVFSFLVIANTGVIANALKYAFIFMFGTCYIFVVLFILGIGIYMTFKKKNFKVFSKIQYVLVLCCFICILALSSYGRNVTIHNFTSVFKTVLPTSLADTKNIVGSYGGGWLGYLLMAIFNTLLGSEGWTLAIYILLLLGFLYLLFQKPLIKVFKKFKKVLAESKKLKKEKQERKKEEYLKQQQKLQEEKQRLLEEEKEKKLQEEMMSSQAPAKSSVFLIQDDVKEDAIESKTLVKEATPYKKLSDFENVIDDLNETKVFARPNFSDSSKTSNDSSFLYQSPEPQLDKSTQNLFVKEEVQPNFLNQNTNEYLKKEREYQEFSKELKQEEKEEPQTNTFVYSSNDSSFEEIKDIKEDEVEKECDLKAFDANKYQLPPLYLLKDNSASIDAMRNEDLARQKADILSQKMQELNVNATITNYTIGPSVTRYEIMLQPGVRANTFMNLQEDFKLALGATSLRIESPIPGKPATIGIEVPNEIRGMVTLKELVLSLPNKKEKLFVPAGKAIGGEPISISITSMPHCLISGATNSGKSVCANSIICSLLLNYKPNEVRMIMVDPKRVEMLFYTNLPHLMCPIITESSKALVALDKLVKEMMRRFDVFAKLGVKNIASYNEVMKQKNKDVMPFIVLIVDEFAELMAYKQSNLVEEKVQSLVQLGRAAGLHLILCTQRPSVNVITGTIKNNIPCRMTFRLSSFADSKTVIDGSGAEKLLNNGDMLLLTPDYTGLRRVQGAYISDKEIDDIVSYCKEQCSPQYDPEFMDLRTEEEKELDIHTKFNMGNTNEEDNGYNAKFLDIRNFVLMEQKASTSLLQRKFKIGYGKAANFIDMLEDEGIIGPENGSKGREVLMTYEEWESKNESQNN